MIKIIELPPPIQGVSKGVPVDKESPATSGHMNNVRPVDVLESKIRIGQRPGLDKWSTDQIGSVEQPIIAMCIVAAVA